MRLLPILLMLLPVALACRTIVVTEMGKYDTNGFSGVRNTVNTSLADVRNTESLVTINDKGKDQGMQLALDKREASPQFMGMVEKVAPEVIDLLGTAMMMRGAGSVAGALEDLISGGPEDILEELEEEAIGELMEKERVRRTPEEKAAAQAERAEKGRN